MTEAIVKHEAQLAVGDAARQSTDIAGVCRAIVKQTVMEIQGRQYVKVEGWQAIASAAGCGVAVVEVAEELAGIKAVAEVRRLSDNALVGRGEGYVGEDEPTWSGGGKNPKTGQPYARRPDYARRALAQTRAISRACRSAFAFIVVLIDADLSTTPAEEVPEGGFNDAPPPARPKPTPPPKASTSDADFTPNPGAYMTGVKVPFGKEKGKDLAEIDNRSLSSLADYLTKQVADPKKAQYQASNQRLLDACSEEGIRREKKP